MSSIGCCPKPHPSNIQASHTGNTRTGRWAVLNLIGASTRSHTVGLRNGVNPKNNEKRVTNEYGHKILHVWNQGVRESVYHWGMSHGNMKHSSCQSLSRYNIFPTLFPKCRQVVRVSEQWKCFSLSIGLVCLPSHGDALYSRLLRHSAKEPHGNITNDGCMRKLLPVQVHVQLLNYPQINEMRICSRAKWIEVKSAGLARPNLVGASQERSCFIGPVIHLVTSGLGTRRSHGDEWLFGLQLCKVIR